MRWRVQGAAGEAIGHYAQALRLRPGLCRRPRQSRQPAGAGPVRGCSGALSAGGGYQPGPGRAWLGLGQILYETERYEGGCGFAKAPEPPTPGWPRPRAAALRRWEDRSRLSPGARQGGDAEIIGYYRRRSARRAGAGGAEASRQHALFDREFRYDQLVGT